MTPSEALEIMADLRDAFPSAKVPPETVRRYAQLVADLDVVEVRRAVAELTCEARFFPAIAEIRERVAANRVALPAAEQAWADVLAAIGRIGMYRTPELDNPVAEFALATIGWQSLCQTPADRIGFARSQFLKAYETGRQLALRSGVEQLRADVDRRALVGKHEGERRRSKGAEQVGGVVMRVLPPAPGGER